MLLEGPHGFGGAPVSRGIWWSVLLSSVLLPNLYSRANLAGLSLRDIGLRIFTSHFICGTPQEIFFCLLFAYAYREFERRYGSRKFVSLWLMIVIISTSLQVAILVALPNQVKVISSGPYALIFGFLINYILEVPSLPIWTVLNFPISYKTFAYCLLAQVNRFDRVVFSVLSFGFVVVFFCVPWFQYRCSLWPFLWIDCTNSTTSSSQSTNPSFVVQGNCSLFPIFTP
jgi:membrane associated rhomboid family serine protease